MARFLLIHGAWHGGWCFDKLRPLLEVRGHVTAAPTLPGIGGSDRELAGASLEAWAEFVAAEARKMPAPPILVGHSRAGIVISAAAERHPDVFAGLVYLSAFLVPSGKSMFEVRDAHPRDAAFEAGLSEAARGAALAISRDGARAAFYGQCTEADVAWACERLVPEPLGPMATPLVLSEASYGSVPRHYVECLQDRAIPIAQQRAMQAALPCASATVLDSDHSPFLSMPQMLAEALHNIAERMEA